VGPRGIRRRGCARRGRHAGPCRFGCSHGAGRHRAHGCHPFLRRWWSSLQRGERLRVGHRGRGRTEYFPDLTTQATIARDGTVQLPLVREVKLAGLTIRDARELLRGLYDKQFLVDPQVFLNVVKFAERKFTIMGQVARPGSYELQGGERIDLLEAIGLAGGFTRIADRGRVIIQRKEAGEVKALKANAKRMADGKADPLEVQPGDVITVKESWF
jgi:polysaccharide export outer membrane protein